MLLHICNQQKALLETFTKNPNRIFSVSNLLQKRDQSYCLAALFQSSFKSKTRDTSDRLLLGRFYGFFYKTLEYVDRLTEVMTTSNPTSNMDIKVAQAIRALEDPKDTGIRDFLDEVEAYCDVLNEPGKAQLIKYIVKAKIKGSCKTRLGETPITTFDELKTALHSKVKPEETYDKLFKRMIKSTQHKSSLPSYASQLESLSSQWAAVYIRTEQVTAEAEKKIVGDIFNMLVLCQFKQGVKDRYKPVIDASRTKTLADALAIASASSSNDNSAELYHLKNSRNHDKKRDEKSKNRKDKKQSNDNKDKPNRSNHGKNHPKQKKIHTLESSEEEEESKN